MICPMIIQASKRVEMLYSSVETSPDHIYRADRITIGTSANPARQERVAIIAAMQTEADSQPVLSPNFKKKQNIKRDEYKSTQDQPPA